MSCKHLFALGLSAAAIAFAHDAGAQETETHWYGHELLIADAASTSVMLVGAGLDSAPLALSGIGGLAVAAPVIHFAHDRPAVGLLSLGMRVLFPVMGAGIGYAAAGPCHDQGTSLLGDCFLHGYGEAVAGSMIAMGVASVIDASFLAVEERKIEKPYDKVRFSGLGGGYDPRSHTTTFSLAGEF